MAVQTQYSEAKQKPFYLAKSEICVNAKGECIGDGIFAGSDYGPGEHIIAVPRPLTASLDTERLSDTCANCFVWTEGSSTGSRLYVKEGTSVQKCAGCKRFHYCSKECQKEAWHRGHKHECKLLKPLGDKEIPKAILACVEILTRKRYGLIPDHQWEMICRLDTHMEEYQQNGKLHGIQLMAFGTRDLTGNAFEPEFVAAMYARILSNCLTLITPTFDPLGIFIDPLFSHLNHSCEPNAYVVMDGAETSLRTLKPIKANEEIYISYIDPTNPFARRQSELKSRWFFTCKCTKCQKETTSQEDDWAVPPQDMSDKYKKIADVILKDKKLKEFAEDPANFVGKSKDEKRAGALQAMAFKKYEEEQQSDPAAAVDLIISGMELCHESKLWPAYRQPYAAFRDDLIVNLLSAGEYQQAFAHCAKRHRHVLPKLYPELAHPIRVVQTWQAASLALYLATTKEGISGVDATLMAYLLTAEVVAASQMSHGPDSAFSKSVQERFGEMDEEVRKKIGSDAVDFLKTELENQRKTLLEMGDWDELKLENVVHY